MPNDQRKCSVSKWLRPDEEDASITVFAEDDESSARHPELIGRTTLAIQCGPASVWLRPTRDEMRAIIRALEWGLAGQLSMEVAA